MEAIMKLSPCWHEAFGDGDFERGESYYYAGAVHGLVA